jgi:NCAIR mutase (PurE)-related protein
MPGDTVGTDRDFAVAVVDTHGGIVRDLKITPEEMRERDIASAEREVEGAKHRLAELLELRKADPEQSFADAQTDEDTIEVAKQMLRNAENALALAKGDPKAKRAQDKRRYPKR